MFLAYVDESGDNTRILHTALLIPAERWTSCLRTWLSWRRDLNSKYHVPASFELHASPFLHGKFEPFPPFMDKDGTLRTPRINSSEGIQREVIESSLKMAGRMRGVRVLTCHQLGTNRMASYRQLLDALEDFLTPEGDQVLLDAQLTRQSVHSGCRSRCPCGLPARRAATAKGSPLGLVRELAG